MLNRVVFTLQDGSTRTREWDDADRIRPKVAALISFLKQQSGSNRVEIKDGEGNFIGFEYRCNVPNNRRTTLLQLVSDLDAGI